MYLLLRSWSLNMYCFSKIWFKTHSVDLRETDCKQITSLAKSWMYADMLSKPEENILHRPFASGLHHVKMKAVAGLIRSFLETACMPRFRPSLYHQLLFRAYVLEEEFLSVPGRPPYYREQFFLYIKHAYQNNMNVTTMTEKDWYQHLA